VVRVARQAAQERYKVTHRRGSVGTITVHYGTRNMHVQNCSPDMCNYLNDQLAAARAAPAAPTAAAAPEGARGA